MAQETWVQSQVESYQRLKKWYLMLPCLILSIIRQGSRVKWSNPRKGVASSPTPWCSSYQKGSLQVILDYRRQLYFYFYFLNPVAIHCFWSDGSQYSWSLNLSGTWLFLLSIHRGLNSLVCLSTLWALSLRKFY